MGVGGSALLRPEGAIEIEMGVKTSRVVFCVFRVASTKCANRLWGGEVVGRGQQTAACECVKATGTECSTLLYPYACS